MLGYVIVQDIALTALYVCFVKFCNNKIPTNIKLSQLSYHDNYSISVTIIIFVSQLQLGPSINIFKLATNVFNPPIVSRFVRFMPETWYVTPCMKFELYGCQVEGQDSDTGQ